MNQTEETINLIASWFDSPTKCIQDLWGLEPQPLKCKEFHHHGKFCYEEFIRGKHITWQQTQILEGIEKALKGEAPRRVSVISGHGIGKDAVCAWLIHWFLLTRENAQIGCTAPTSEQMYDVLWKEIAVWQQRLPQEIADMFEWSTTHYKIKEKPQTWWARARTAKKESPEAFAGLHGEYVMLIGDEAAAIPDEIYRVAEGSLTSLDTLVFLIGNPTRLEGYFYDTHNDPKERAQWQVFSFNSEESPIVPPGFPERIAAKFGKDSDEYQYMVLGQFPKQEGMIKGWQPLLAESELKIVSDVGSFVNPVLGIDAAGEGSNKTVCVVRDAFRAKVVSEEEKSNPKSIARTAITLCSHYSIPVEKVVIDNFGEGANVGAEIALATRKRARGINVGDSADDSERFANKRAELYWRAREWILKGGQLVKHEGWKQLTKIYYRRTLTGKIIMIPKNLDKVPKELRKHLNLQSPDCFVAGTKIKTPNGEVNIESLKKGDMVSTPWGTRQVIKHWETNVNELYKVTFSNGQSLTGKGKHKIYTDRGFIRLDALTLIDSIEAWDKINLFIWKIKRALFFRDANIGLRKLADIFTMMSTMAGAKELEKRKLFIAPFGSIILVGRFLKDMLFTILTTMFLTIPTEIYNWLNPLSMGKFIWRNDLLIKNLRNQMLSNLMLSARLPLNGMGVQRGAGGIVNMENEHGLEEKRKNLIVKDAGQKRPGMAEKDFVLVLVNRKVVMASIKLLRRFAFSVKKFLWHLNIKKLNIVVESVQILTVVKTKVYNLTLDKDNVYYANGILVENCADSFMLSFDVKFSGEAGRVSQELSDSEINRLVKIY